MEPSVAIRRGKENSYGNLSCSWPNFNQTFEVGFLINNNNNMNYNNNKNNGNNNNENNISSITDPILTKL